MIKAPFFRKHPQRFYLNLGIFALVTSALVFTGTMIFPKQYRAYNTYFIDAQYLDTSESIIDFSPQQLAEKTTDNIKGIIESRNFLGRVLDNAGFENSSKAREKFSRKILVKKVGPQVLFVQIRGSDEQTLVKTITSLTKALDGEVSSINSNGNILIAFNEVNGAPNVEEVQMYPWLNALLGFVVVIIVGVSFREFKKYLNS